MYQQVSSYTNMMAEKFLHESPENLMVMLYEGMITRIRRGREFYKAGQLVRARESSMQASRIASALMDNLNFEEGGETVRNLERLYAYVISEVSASCISQDPSPHYQNILSVLETLCGSWKELSGRSK